MDDHDRELAAAFDGQAARFERAPVQRDPALLGRLVEFVDLPPDALVLDAGCGPGLVSEALLRAGHRVRGVDLSGEMIARARARCAAFGDRAAFTVGSILDAALAGPFDAAVSRLVLHHAPDPAALVRRQAELLRPGGVLVACDHTTDPDPDSAAWHRGVERARDRTHTANLTPGQLVDLLAGAGLVDLRLAEASFELDLDEWFDRGTPSEHKEHVREGLLASAGVRGFRPRPAGGGRVTIEGWLAMVRGVRPAED